MWTRPQTGIGYNTTKVSSIPLYIFVSVKQSEIYWIYLQPRRSSAAAAGIPKDRNSTTI